MDNNSFVSGLSESIIAFIEQKQSVGYLYKAQSNCLMKFDRMVGNEFPEANTITIDMCEKWIKMHECLHPNTMIKMVVPVRQLAKYMIGAGKTAYVIPSYVGRKQLKYQAHIFTSEEKEAFFRMADSCQPCINSPTKPYVLPVIFRVMYCCGLRETEALNLAVDDVNLETGQVAIRESKGWKARNVYLSDGMIHQCRFYDQAISKVVPLREAFFPNRYGTSAFKN